MELTDYIIRNNEDGAVNLIINHGIPKPVTHSQASQALAHLIKRGGESFLMELADEHPDYGLIEKRVLQKHKISNFGGERMLNSQGDESKTIEELKATFVKEMKRAEERTSNASGDIVSTVKDNQMTAILVGGIFIIAALIIWKTR